jgi:hypothetical protein
MAIVYLSRAGWTATASSQWDASMSPDKALDGNNGTHWNTANGLGNGSTYTVDMAVAHSFNVIELIPRQDTRTGDPQYIRIDTSNNGSVWTLAGEASPASDSTAKLLPVAGTQTARWVRLTSRGYTGNVGWAEIRAGMADPAYPLDPVDIAPHNMISNTSPVPFVAAASSEFNNQFRAYLAFDGLAGTLRYWLGSGAGVDWLRLDLGAGNARKLVSYSVKVNTIPETARAPKAWTMQGSNDATAWNTLDTVTNQTAWASGETRTFGCDATGTAWRYFRLNITANNGDAAYTQVAELSLYVQQDAAAITGSGGVRCGAMLYGTGSTGV